MSKSKRNEFKEKFHWEKFHSQIIGILKGMLCVKHTNKINRKIKVWDKFPKPYTWKSD